MFSEFLFLFDTIKLTCCTCMWLAIMPQHHDIKYGTNFLLLRHPNLSLGLLKQTNFHENIYNTKRYVISFKVKL